jgi:hypothetical protein
MLSYLGSPSVVVIDDEPDDYEPIIQALLGLGVACAHFRGRNGDPLPSVPLESVRLVFADLHLNGQLGKGAAAHTANVVRQIVSADKGPVLVVIWSKYASDPVDGVPQEDQPTEADEFKATLLGAVKGYQSRLLFTEMAKPKLPDRPNGPAWTESLKEHIVAALNSAEAFQVMWIWESLLRKGGIAAEEALISLAEERAETGQTHETLRIILRHLAQLQAGPDAREDTICKHLMSVFSQLSADSVEWGAATLDPPYSAEWLCEPVTRDQQRLLDLAKKLNALLQTAPSAPAAAEFVPGTLFEVADVTAFSDATGFTMASLATDCSNNDQGRDALIASGRPVLLELTPQCDFHQKNRRVATFVVGILFPAADARHAKSKDACKTVPLFEDRFKAPPVDVGVVFCSRYRLTLPLNGHPPWLAARLRFRDGVLTDVRNWCAAQESRAGYLVV